MAIWRDGRVRVSTRFQYSTTHTRGSGRNYLTARHQTGSYSESDLDGFVGLLSSYYTALSDAVPAAMWARIKFDDTDPLRDRGESQLVEGAVFVFRVDDPADARYYSFYIPGIPPSSPIFRPDELIDGGNPDVVDFVQFILTNFTNVQGDTLASFEGGYRAFSRYDDQ